MYDGSSLGRLNEGKDENSDGDEDDDVGPNVESMFLGTNVKPKRTSVAKSSTKSSTPSATQSGNTGKGKRQQKGKGPAAQPMYSMPMPYMPMPMMMTPQQQQVMGKKMKKRKPITKRIRKWDMEKCENELQKFDGYVIKNMVEFKTLVESNQNIGRIVKDALKNNADTIMKFAENPSAVGFVSTLKYMVQTVNPVKIALRERNAGKPKRNKFFKTSTKPTLVIDEQSIIEEYNRDLQNIGRFLKYLILKLAKLLYRLIKMDLRENNDERSITDINKTLKKLEKSSQIRDVIYNRILFLLTEEDVQEHEDDEKPENSRGRSQTPKSRTESRSSSRAGSATPSQGSVDRRRSAPRDPSTGRIIIQRA